MPESVHETSHTLVYPDRIPPAAVILTALGFVPFAALAMGTVFLPEEHRQPALQFQHLYGAVILSFLGGIYWGWEMAICYAQTRPVSSARLLIGILPPLFGWLALLLPGTLPSFALAACFCILLAYDLWRTTQHQVPRWYPALRIPITVVVVTSLLLPAVLR